MSSFKGPINVCNVVIRGGAKSTAPLPETRRRAAVMATVIAGIAK